MSREEKIVLGSGAIFFGALLAQELGVRGFANEAASLNLDTAAKLARASFWLRDFAIALFVLALILLVGYLAVTLLGPGDTGTTTT